MTIEAATLKAALHDVMAAVPTRSPRPILQNVRLGDGLLTGDDLELRIDREIDYHGDAILLPAHRLRAILDNVAPDAEVTLTPQGTSCKVKAGRGSWTLPTEDAAEFPAAATDELKAVCRLPADEFARAIRSTFYATDKDSSRYALGAVLLSVKQGNPTFVATDGRRLSIVEAETDQAVDDRDLLVPIRAATALIKRFKKKKKRDDDDAINDSSLEPGDIDPNTTSVQVDTDDRRVVFSCGPLTVSGVLVSGVFPRWRDAVPKREQASPTTVDRGQLLAATKAAAIVTSEQSKGVDFTFGKSLKLEAQSAEAGKSTVTCEVEDAGDAGKVKLDPRYVVEFLKNLPGESDPTVTVDIAGPGDAVVIRCDAATGVIMPLSE